MARETATQNISVGMVIQTASSGDGSRADVTFTLATTDLARARPLVEETALLAPHYKRADDEGRTLVQTALASAATLEVTDGELRVTLAPLSSAHRSRAIAAVCEELNRAPKRFPGTNLRLRFAVEIAKSAHEP
jgi:hypothetical protein